MKKKIHCREGVICEDCEESKACRDAIMAEKAIIERYEKAKKMGITEDEINN